LEHAANPLAELLAEVKVRAYASNPGVPREPRRVERVREIDQAGKPPGTRNLDTVSEDLYANVIAGNAVRTVDGRIDESFEPGILGDDRNVLEPATPSKSSSCGLIRAHHGSCFHELAGNRPFKAFIEYELLG
jgi:hypothetical protein